MNRKVRKVKKSIITVFSVFVLSLMILTGHAMVTFWSGATFDWEEAIYSPELAGKTIIIDPGHGGRDPGVTYNGIDEKDINLAIAKRLETLLEEKGAKVHLTRDDSKGLISDKVMTYQESAELLAKRRDTVLNKKASLLVSIHVNSFSSNPAVKGPIAFYKDNNFLNQSLAKNIQARLNTATNNKRDVREAEFVVLTQDIVPSVLVEVGFLTNPQDFSMMTSGEGQQQIATGIVKGIEDFHIYLGELKKIREEEVKE